MRVHHTCTQMRFRLCEGHAHGGSLVSGLVGLGDERAERTTFVNDVDVHM